MRTDKEVHPSHPYCTSSRQPWPSRHCDSTRNVTSPTHYVVHIQPSHSSLSKIIYVIQLFIQMNMGVVYHSSQVVLNKFIITNQLGFAMSVIKQYNYMRLFGKFYNKIQMSSAYKSLRSTTEHVGVKLYTPATLLNLYEIYDCCRTILL